MMSAIPSAPPPSYDATVTNADKTQGGAPNTTNNAGGYNAPPGQGYSYQPGATGYSNPQTQYGQLQPQYQDEDATFNTRSFSDKVIRNQFIRKVYLILMMQLLFTFAIVAVFVFVDPVYVWVRKNSWAYYLSYGVFLVTYIALACCPSVRRKYPGNYIALTVFTMAFTYVCATIASFHNAKAVLIAAGITAVVTLAISLFACQTKIDFTMCSGLIFAASIVLMVIGILYLIIFMVIPPGEGGRNYYYLQCAYGGIAALILSLFLVYDTQMIVGGKHERGIRLSAEEHVLGALQLYMDIVNLFLMILSFFSNDN